jgi:hypothetical protein
MPIELYPAQALEKPWLASGFGSPSEGRESTKNVKMPGNIRIYMDTHSL